MPEYPSIVFAGHRRRRRDSTSTTTSRAAASRRCARRARWRRTTSSPSSTPRACAAAAAPFFPTGRKWSLRAEARAAREAALPRRQRRRVGAGHVQGPRDHAAASRSASSRAASSPRTGSSRSTSSSTSAASTSASSRSCATRSRRCARRELLGGVTVVLHRGAGAYICGEETALLESLEGKRGQPRTKPPFPAIAGLYAAPTAVNNVESITTVTPVLEMGGAEYAKLGVENSTGHARLLALRQRRRTPATTSCRTGSRCASSSTTSAAASPNGRELKAVIPGGSSTSVLTADEIDTTMDFDSLVEAGLVDRLGGRDRHRRPLLHGAARHPRLAVLRARVVREVHAVPRRHEVGHADPPEDRGRPRARRPTSTCSLSVCDRIIGKCLCPLGDSDAIAVLELRRQVPRRVPGAHRPGPLPVRRRVVARGDRSRPSTMHARARPRGARMSELVTVTVDDRQVEVPKGTGLVEAAAGRGDRDSGLLLRAAARPAGRRVPHVPRRDRGHAEAPGRLHAHRRSDGMVDQDERDVGEGGGGPGGDARVHPRQPPARLPGLRQGRRVPAAGPDVPLRARQHADVLPEAHGRQADPRLAARSRSTASAASSATAARASRRTSPRTASSSRATAARARRSRPSRTSRTARRSPATSSSSAPSARSPRRCTASTRGRGTSRTSRPSAPAAPSAATRRATIREGKVKRILSRNHPEVDRGWLCDKGRFSYPHLRAERPHHDAARRVAAQGLEEVSWDDALDEAEAMLRDAGRLDRDGVLGLGDDRASRTRSGGSCAAGSARTRPCSPRRRRTRSRRSACRSAAIAEARDRRRRRRRPGRRARADRRPLDQGGAPARRRGRRLLADGHGEDRARLGAATLPRAGAPDAARSRRGCARPSGRSSSGRARAEAAERASRSSRTSSDSRASPAAARSICRRRRTRGASRSAWAVAADADETNPEPIELLDRLGRRGGGRSATCARSPSRREPRDRAHDVPRARRRLGRPDPARDRLARARRHVDEPRGPRAAPAPRRHPAVPRRARLDLEARGALRRRRPAARGGRLRRAVRAALPRPRPSTSSARTRRFPARQAYVAPAPRRRPRRRRRAEASTSSASCGCSATGRSSPAPPSSACPSSSSSVPTPRSSCRAADAERRGIANGDARRRALERHLRRAARARQPQARRRRRARRRRARRRPPPRRSRW